MYFVSFSHFSTLQDTGIRHDDAVKLTFAEIELFIYLYIVKEMMIVKTITKSDEFSVVLIQWLS